MVTLPAKSLRSLSEWFVSTNLAMIWFLLLAFCSNRMPDTSINFCHGLTGAPGFAAALSTVVDGVADVLCDPNNQYAPITTTANPAVQRMVSSQVGIAGFCSATEGAANKEDDARVSRTGSLASIGGARTAAAVGWGAGGGGGGGGA
jgi:hypothetical protein